VTRSPFLEEKQALVPTTPLPPWILAILSRKEWRPPLLFLSWSLLPLSFALSQLFRFVEPLLPEELERKIGVSRLGNWLENREEVIAFLERLEREDSSP